MKISIPEKSFLTLLVWILSTIAVFPQGKLVLIGGGSEAEGGWSDAPYGWAVEMSANKKVAVISYSDEDNFMPDYFLSLGAAVADNIKIDSRSLADLQSTYDSLMRYDVLFFKGGDQSIYYEHYRGSKTVDAITDKFYEGGVIAGTSAGMAILSGVMFTANNGSVYPDEALSDVTRDEIALADDFLQIFPGYLFDSHFTERGRVGRLLPFMAKWFLDKGEPITGIGVDDRTAFCIDQEKQAFVSGTGSVSLYTCPEFSSHDRKPVADSVHSIQLLHGHSIDLTSLSITSGPDEVIVPEVQEQSGNYTVLLSGGEGISSNTAFLTHLVDDPGNGSDTIVVVAAPGKGAAYKQKLQSLGAVAVLIETHGASNAETRIDLRNAIRNCGKVLFVENTELLLFDFLKGTTGRLLEQHVRRNKIISAFVGQDSRLAGSVFVTNHLGDPFAAYYGKLRYQEGLNLVHSAVIMANTYDANDTDYYENTTAAVSFGLIDSGLKYGVYLNRNSFMKLQPDGGRNTFTGFGDLSTIVLINEGTTAGVASEPVNAAGDTRSYVGFSSMQYVLLNGTMSIDAGEALVSNDIPYEYETPVTGLESEFPTPIGIFPNPSNNGVFFLSGQLPIPSSISVTDHLGRKVMSDTPVADRRTIDLTAFPDGIYLIHIYSGAEVFSMKGIKHSTFRP